MELLILVQSQRFAMAIASSSSRFVFARQSPHNRSIFKLRMAAFSTRIDPKNRPQLTLATLGIDPKNPLKGTKDWDFEDKVENLGGKKDKSGKFNVEKSNLDARKGKSGSFDVEISKLGTKKGKGGSSDVEMSNSVTKKGKGGRFNDDFRNSQNTLIETKDWDLDTKKVKNGSIDEGISDSVARNGKGGSFDGEASNSVMKSTKDGVFDVETVDSGKKSVRDQVFGARSLVSKTKIYMDRKSNVKSPRDRISDLKNSNLDLKPVRSSLMESKYSRPDKSRPVIDESLFSAKSFAELSLSELLISRLNEIGLTVPTEVQSAAIPTILQKCDAVIQSYTGSGKTLAYLLPILSEIGPLRKSDDEGSSKVPGQKQGIEAVIVAPSRELGMQIVREVERLLGPVDKRLVQQLVGGANRARQEEALKKNKPIIVVGTPGRIAEISAAGKLHTHGCRYLILDEVDELLSFNYREDMHRILEHVGKKSSGTKSSEVLGQLARLTERQTILVSATVPFSVVRAARSWGHDPVLVRAKSVVPLDSISNPGVSPFHSVSGENSSSSVTQGAVDSLPPALKHYYCVSKIQHKVDTLRRCVHALDAKAVIAFMNNTKPLKDVVYKLNARGMNAAELHGDLGKLARTTTLKKFKDGEVRVLVTNELSARGLDVPECDLVVNLDLPTDSIHYAHRAGRTGRLGREGHVVTICEEPEIFVVKKLRRQLSVSIQPCEFTEGKLIISKEDEEVRSDQEAR